MATSRQQRGHALLPIDEAIELAQKCAEQFWALAYQCLPEENKG